MTGLDRRCVSKELRVLVERKIVVKKTDSFVSEHGIQQDSTKWKLSTKTTLSAKLPTPIAENNDKTVGKNPVLDGSQSAR